MYPQTTYYLKVSHYGYVGTRVPMGSYLIDPNEKGRGCLSHFQCLCMARYLGLTEVGFEHSQSLE